MENKARKMFAAVVVIMLCAVAIVGVGYAYTATTTNDDNNIVSENVVLTQKTGDYTFVDSSVHTTNYKVYYDTENGASSTKYILKNGETTTVNAPEITNITDGTGKKFYGLPLGVTDNTLVATFTGLDANAPEAFPIVLSSTSGPNAPAGWYVIIVFENGGAYQYALYGDGGSAWKYYGSTGVEQPCILMEKSDTKTSKTYDIDLYYAAKDAGSDGYGSSTTPPHAQPLNNTDLKFVYTHSAILSSHSITQTTTLTATHGLTEPTVTWFSTNTTVATVSDGTVTLTETSGTAYILYKAEKGADVLCDVCKVVKS